KHAMTNTYSKGTNHQSFADSVHTATNPESREPKYRQVLRTLKQEIVDGIYPIGSKLPTEEDLRHRFGVSRHTIREALRRLRRDNLVTSKPRVGTVVVYRPAENSYAQDVMSIEDLLSWSADKYYVIDTIDFKEIDESQAYTGLTVGESWL